VLASDGGIIGGDQEETNEEQEGEEEEEEITGHDTPQRSESADFGLGDSTGVQEL
jgi:hypothetical protein